VLHGVGFRTHPGCWLAVIGPNGAGKSTLLQAIASVVGSTGGIEIDGVALDSLPRRERARQIALVPQQPTIPSGLSVTGYVLLGRTPRIGMFSVESTADVAIVGDALERLDLEWAAGRRVDSLSGGEFQRAVIARAIVQQPRVLLLDEPTTALDLGHQQRALELVAELREASGLAVLSAMHDLTLASQFADRFLLLRDGSVVAEGEAPDVLDPALIKRHFGASVDVIVTERGGLAVIPVRDAARGRAAG
jgi:iron complex transport system ATP-binding protein